jgi:hypothetical protein
MLDEASPYITHINKTSPTMSGRALGYYRCRCFRTQPVAGKALSPVAVNILFKPHNQGVIPVRHDKRSAEWIDLFNLFRYS